MTLSRRLASLALLALSVAPAAFAAPAPPRNVRGEVVELTADRIAVRTDGGETLRMRLAPTWSVQVFRPIKLAEIPVGAFVGAVETPLGPDAGLAHEVHRFQPGVRMGEGRLPWDRPAGSTITSGEIGPVVATVRGQEFDLSYSGQKRHIVAPTGAPVVLVSNEGHENIHVGAKVFILAWPEADGALRVDAVATGPGGALPPL